MSLLDLFYPPRVRAPIPDILHCKDPDDYKRYRHLIYTRRAHRKNPRSPEAKRRTYERNKKRRLENPEKFRAEMKAWYERNREKQKEYFRRYRASRRPGSKRDTERNTSSSPDIVRLETNEIGS